MLHTSTYNIFFLVYVANILIGSLNAPISQLIHCLQNKFNIKDLGSLQYFLDIEAKFTLKGLLLEIIAYVKVKETHGVFTPYSITHLPSFNDGEPFHDPTHYHSIMGAL